MLIVLLSLSRVAHDDQLFFKKYFLLLIEPVPLTSSSVSPVSSSFMSPLPTNPVCSVTCTKCNSSGCCLQCSSEYALDGCGCG